MATSNKHVSAIVHAAAVFLESDGERGTYTPCRLTAPPRRGVSKDNEINARGCENITSLEDIGPGILDGMGSTSPMSVCPGTSPRLGRGGILRILVSSRASGSINQYHARRLESFPTFMTS